MTSPTTTIAGGGEAQARRPVSEVATDASHKDAMTDRTATLTFSDGTAPVTFPLLEGTIGPDVIDIRTLYGKTGKFTYDPGFLSTASCDSAITYIDGDKGELLYRGYPIEELAVKCDFLEVCYLLLYGELPTKEQEQEVRRRRHPSHDGQRADAVLHAGFPPRRASHGRADGSRRRDERVLSGLDGPARRPPARHLGAPPHRQDADTGCDGLQIHGRPALRLSAQRAIVRGELHADDVRDAVRGVQGQPGAGAWRSTASSSSTPTTSRMRRRPRSACVLRRARTRSRPLPQASLACGALRTAAPTRRRSTCSTTSRRTAAWRRWASSSRR